VKFGRRKHRRAKLARMTHDYAVARYQDAKQRRAAEQRKQDNGKAKSQTAGRQPQCNEDRNETPRYKAPGRRAA